MPTTPTHPLPHSLVFALVFALAVALPCGPALAVDTEIYLSQLSQRNATIISRGFGNATKA